MNATSPSLRKDPGTALHRQLFMVLRDQISQGVYADGDLIPREADLCARYGVSRITVRRAISDLEQLGLVEKRQGRGTFVRSVPRRTRPQATLGLIDSLAKAARETEVKVLLVEAIPASPAIGEQLELPVGSTVVHAVRLRSAKGIPLMVTEAWVPEEVGSKVTKGALRKQALFEILMEQGVKFERVVQEVTAVSADPHLAGLLQVDIGSPLLRMTRILYDRKKMPVQYLTIHVTSERSRILMDVSADAINTTGAGQIVHDMPAG
jgi:GntR family transcriptional regulator